MKKALIVIDVQNYFINEHTEHIPGLISNHLSRQNYDLLIFTSFINKTDSNFSRILEWDKCFDAPDTDIVNELINRNQNIHIIRRSSYSAVTNELEQLLNFSQIHQAFICGIDTDACVIATAFDLFDLGYNFEIIEELCASTEGEETHKAALKLMQRNLKRQKNITA